MTIVERCRPWLAGAVVCLLLAGCATSTENMTADEQLLREQSDSFVAENVFGGAAEGAIIGAIAGAILGGIIGGDATSMGYGAAAGAGAGAIAGGVDGYIQAKEAQYQADQVLMARAVAEDIRADNEKLANYLQTASRVVERDKQKLALLQSQVATKQMSLDQAREEAALVRDNSETIAGVLDDAKAKRDNYVESRASLADTSDVDAEISRLNTQIAQLEQQLTQLNASLELTDLSG
jgi:outer membrane lipoprotein SlyB